MTEYVEFSDFVTKGLTVDTADQRRIFKGHITAEIIDRQQEFIFVKEVMKIMEAFMEVNPVISDYHSNRMVGKVLSYEQSEYKGVATVLITGEVYKKDGITLYDKIWDKVVKGEYSGLSMGGASKEREPIQKDGKMALELRKLELYEIALCDTPANPFAVVESVNKFAKANGIERMVKDFNGREQIRCTSLGCKFEKFDLEQFIDKSNGEDINVDVDIDNTQTNSDNKSEKENGMEQFDKPEEVGKLDSKTIVNRSAETRAETVGEATGSPKETNDLVDSIPKVPTAQVKQIPLQRITKDHIPSTPKDDDYLEEAQNKQDKINGKEITKDQPIGDINAKGEFPMKPRQKPNTMTDSNGNVNKTDPCWEGYEQAGMKEKDGKQVPNCITKADNPVNLILKFGITVVKEALEEAETIQYLKTLHKKYQQ